MKAAGLVLQQVIHSLIPVSLSQLHSVADLPGQNCYQLLFSSLNKYLPLIFSTEKLGAGCDDGAGQEVFLWVKVFPPLL